QGQEQQQQPPAPLQPELSSDATIPVSDNVAPEDVPEKSVEHDISLDSGLYSPGHHAAMHSSPPIPRHVKVPSGTPPRPPRLAGSSASRSRKRKFASMDDSGYISSLDSSVMRPNQKGGLLLTSEADRPRIKRGGRAEEEIARLRASSYDSPTKGRSWNGFAPQSSSPLRQANESHHQMPPPLTPAVKLRAPVKPPPSVSPNTNLRMHRSKIQHMLQSPLRRMTTFQDENDPWSPAFQLDESAYSANDFSSLDAGALDGTFDIFRDSALDSLFPAIENGSPEKRSAKRVRLDHHRTVSASILGDITNSASRRPITSAPLLKVPGPSPARLLDTPSKVFDGLPSPSKLFSTQQSPSKMPTTAGGDDQNVSPWITLDEFCGTGFFEDVGTDLTGMDMLQGFEKIGSSSSSSSQPSRASQALLGKPHLGRSNTSAF
ncbi:MAG: hypothetical protein OK454_04415, partial [Thaumarchaeota archaeon]|nr:hypothetical protein [Nitrososphaerota archaeon]